MNIMKNQVQEVELKYIIRHPSNKKVLTGVLKQDDNFELATITEIENDIDKSIKYQKKQGLFEDGETRKDYNLGKRIQCDEGIYIWDDTLEVYLQESKIKISKIWNHDEITLAIFEHEKEKFKNPEVAKKTSFIGDKFKYVDELGESIITVKKHEIDLKKSILTIEGLSDRPCNKSNSGKNLLLKIERELVPIK